MESSSQLAKPLPDCIYDENYYRSHLGPEPYDRSNSAIVTLFATVADQLIRSLQPRRVLDAGCAMGFLVEAFRDRGVEAWGIDISRYAISQVRRDIVPYCRVASLTDPIGQKYDLVTCIEVLEHLSESDSLTAMGNLCAATDTILFSSSPTDFTEFTHINVRQPLWWLERFQDFGFEPELMYDASFLVPHAFLLRKRDQRLEWPVLRTFSELLRYKTGIVNRDQEIANLRGAHDCLRNEALLLQTQLKAELFVSIEELRAQCQYEEKQLRSEYQNELASVRAEILDLRAALDSHMARRQELENSTAALLERHLLLVREMERFANPASFLRVPEGREALDPRAGDIEVKLYAVRSELNALNERTRSVSKQVNDILQSRIWQTLAKMGGLVLRALPGK